MRTVFLGLIAALALVGGACSRVGEKPPVASAPQAPAATPDISAVADDTGVNLIVAPGVKGRVDEALVLDAFRRSVAQGEKDFGIRPVHTIALYIDPDGAIGLEDALGLSSKNAIHLRAGRTQRMDSLLPLMMHEYTHVLQHQIGRLRPQWWIEGQAEHESQRILDPGKAEQNRRALVRQLASDVRAGRAPALDQLRGNTAWDTYVDKSGAGRAYGWGNVAVAFIEDRAGFEGVARVMLDASGPNSLTTFDESVRRETGLGPQEFDAALKQWLLQQA